VTKIRSSDGLDQLSPPEKRKKRKEKKRKEINILHPALGVDDVSQRVSLKSYFH
jgi:hypothetical protein